MTYTRMHFHICTSGGYTTLQAVRHMSTHTHVQTRINMGNADTATQPAWHASKHTALQIHALPG